MLQFIKKLKFTPKTKRYVFASKFICNHLYLLRFICIIYLQSSTKVLFTTGTSHWTTGLSVKSILEVTLYQNVPDNSIYDLPHILFFSIWPQHLTPLLVLKCFNCSDSLVNLVFLQHHLIGAQYQIWGSCSNECQ